MFDFLKKKDGSLDKLQNDLSKLETQNPANQQQSIFDEPQAGTEDPNFSSTFSQNTSQFEDKFDPHNIKHDFPEDPQPQQQNYNYQGYPQNQPQQNTARYSNQDHNQEIISKNLEVLNSKLDTIRISLESINQRLVSLERIAAGENNNNRRQW
ncbi:hypothetical protein JXM83_04175 [Candidatus Woesearchaeota archaeon]|nr:hypothetical protein [Candidatus Woesearchaeota archaeon]